MNIFVFSQDLYKSAWYFWHVDPVRANKQLVELAQCIAVAYHHHTGRVMLRADGQPYSVKNHASHPVVRWMIAHDLYPLDRLKWSAMYAYYLHEEYVRLKGKVHASGMAVMPVMRHLAPVEWKHVQPAHHGNNVPRTGMVYADYISYLNKKKGEGNASKTV